MLRRMAPLVTVVACVTALAGHMTTVRAASGGSAALPQLRAVSTRDDGRVSAVVIEATEPVAYVTSQPDPLTVLVDLRNVRSAGVQPPFTGRGASPLGAVRVEEGRAADGTPLARVRVTLDRAAAHRVRTSRNLIMVEVDPLRCPSAAATAAVARAAATEAARRARFAVGRRSDGHHRRQRSAQGDHRRGGQGHAAACCSTSRASPPAAPCRPLSASTRPMSPGVRVATNSREPLITRVVVDLKRRLEYRVEAAGADSDEVRVVFAAPDAPARGPNPPRRRWLPAVAPARDVVTPAMDLPPRPRPCRKSLQCR